MTALVARAPAKINLCLFLGGARSDGRHELVTVMQSVSLADEVRLVPAGERGDGGDAVICPGVEGENIAAATLAAFRERTGWDAGPLRVEIDKRIPVAGGMAGGSADAGAVLRLAALACGGVEDDVLMEIASGLGSDVPAQVRPGHVLATGAGERVVRLAEPPPFGVLVLPAQAPLSTADVYAEADRLGLARSDDELEELLGRVRVGVLDVGDAGDVGDQLSWLFHNDLEPAALSLEPAIDWALEAAREAGAHAALVSGSGPTVLGLFAGAGGPDAARVAADGLRGRFAGAVAAEPVGEDFAAARRSGAPQ